MLVKKLLILLSLVAALKLDCACTYNQDPAQEQDFRHFNAKALEKPEDGSSARQKMYRMEYDCSNCDEDYRSKRGLLKSLDSDTLKLILLTLFVESEKFVMAVFSIAYGATESIFSIANLFVKYGLCSSRS
jgi:hypothetical protein